MKPSAERWMATHNHTAGLSDLEIQAFAIGLTARAIGHKLNMTVDIDLLHDRCMQAILKGIRTALHGTMPFQFLKKLLSLAEFTVFTPKNDSIAILFVFDLTKLRDRYTTKALAPPMEN